MRSACPLPLTDSPVHTFIKADTAVRISTPGSIVPVGSIIDTGAPFEKAMPAAQDKNRPLRKGTYVDTGAP